MTGESFNLSNDAAEIGRFKYMVTLGDKYAQVAEYGNANVSPYGQEGWDFLGYSTALTPNFTPEYYPIKTGSPETLKGNIIVAQSLNYAMTFMMASYTGWKLANGNDLAATITYASDGQVTISSATKNTGTLSANVANEIKVDDTFLVDLTHGTNLSYAAAGTFLAMCRVVALDATGLLATFTRIPQVPTNGSDFKKLKGWPATAASGISWKMGGSNVKTVQFRTVTMSIPDKAIIFDYHPQVELIQPTPFTASDRKTPMSFGITAAVIPTYESVADDNGVTTVQPIIGTRYFLPYES